MKKAVASSKDILVNVKVYFTQRRKEMLRRDGKIPDLLIRVIERTSVRIIHWMIRRQGTMIVTSKVGSKIENGLLRPYEL